MKGVLSLKGTARNLRVAEVKQLPSALPEIKVRAAFLATDEKQLQAFVASAGVKRPFLLWISKSCELAAIKLSGLALPIIFAGELLYYLLSGSFFPFGFLNLWQSDWYFLNMLLGMPWTFHVLLWAAILWAVSGFSQHWYHSSRGRGLRLK